MTPAGVNPLETFLLSLAKIVNARYIKRSSNDIIHVSSSDGKQVIDAGFAMGRHEKLL